MLRFFERTVDPFPEAGEEGPPRGLWAFCWHYVKSASPWLLLMACLSALIAIGEATLFGFLGRLVDLLEASDRVRFLDENTTTLLSMGALVLVGLPLLNLLSSAVVHQAILGNLPMGARWRMHNWLLGQSMGFFANEYAGRVSTKVLQTALAVREVVVKVLDVFVFVGVFFLSMATLLGEADLRLLLPLALWFVVYVGLIAYFVPRLGRISKRQADARSVMTGRIVDSYANIATVKLFAHAGREAAYAREGMDRFLGTVYPQMRLVTTLKALVYLNNCLLVFTVSAVAIHLWTNGAIPTGAIALGIALALRVNGLSQWIMWEVSMLFENIGVVHDGISMMSKERSVTDRSDAQALPTVRGRVTFDHVRFHYGKEAGVFEDLSLRIEPGEKVGLVGRSGAGKSTLVNLLLRFYDVEGGRISIDGHDVDRVTQESLRAQIGMVTQDTALLHRSIRENIAYGRPEASEEEIVDAARRANALAFIQEMEDQDGRTGLDARVGERGVRLSGGQRQRIAIARVFLKNAPILILDEATSALDSEVEAAIQENLFELMKGKTVIAIAHRLSTIAALDRLVVLNEGEIVEEGRHEDLVAAGGLYADLWAHQSGGFLAEDATYAAE
jgi:ATP-binding cassette subfamily B multidrug efflux pump